MHYLICYDLEQDRDRQRLFNLLRDYGCVPTQLSLFICELSPAEKHQLLREAALLLDLSSDRFFLYPVCQHCMTATHRAGDQQPSFLSDPVKVV